MIFIAFITLGCLAEENIEEFTEKVLSRLNNVYDRLQSAEDIIKGLIEGNCFLPWPSLGWPVLRSSSKAKFSRDAVPVPTPNFEAFLG